MRNIFKIPSITYLFGCSIVFTGSILTVHAQELNTNQLELEIKTNSEYLYIQTLENDTINGKVHASEFFWNSSEVQQELLTNTSLNKDDIDFLIKHRGPNFLIIVYISKSTENKNQKVVEQPVRKSDINTVVSTTQLISQGTKSIIQSENPTKKAEIESQNEKKEINAIADVKCQIEVPYISSSIILNDLSHLSDFSDIVDYLNKQKMKGKLVYSYRNDAFRDNINDCFVIVFDSTAKVPTMILDKGKSDRMNILNSQMVTGNNFNNSSKNIYVYEY
jgi:hypothetical protein